VKPSLRSKLDSLVGRLNDLNGLLASENATRDMEQFKKLSREHSELSNLAALYESYRKAEGDAEAARELDLAEELKNARAAMERLEGELQKTLLPKDPNDERNIFLEVRAGAGGDEAGLFAAELLRMYLRFAERKGWKATLMDSSDNAAGGIKDASVTIEGDGVYSYLKYESGVHRVQRVPATEAQGRIHTSTATVSVMPEAEEVDVQINPADIQMDVMRSTGSGGQSVNTTDSAVRLTHKPTGVVVKCQQEKSQIKNRAMAMKMLRAKLYEMEQEKQRSARDAQRKSQVGTGDRSEKIRTYNFPQDRLTDHRIGLTRHNLAAVMDGDIEDVIVACRTFFQAEALRQQQAQA
jgi:peptide chain release factor 1